MGERYKLIPKETKELVRGMYGRTPVPISNDICRKIIGNEEPKTCRPADLLEPELEKAAKEMSEYRKQDEDVLTYTLFPQIAMEFFKFRQAQEYGIDPALADSKSKVYPV